jgi:class 3 adenylate cyclase
MPGSTLVTEAPAGDRIEEILSRHGPAPPRRLLGVERQRQLASSGSAPVHAAVVVGDLRMSGLLLREAVSPALFARYIVGFTEAVRTLANDFGGWFDKFTGDGFIVFWLYEAEEALVRTVPDFCLCVLPAAEALIANLRKNSRNFPAGVGLSLGLDAGPCELVLVGNALTILGSPIVGATRMVSGARAGRALVNVGLGALFEAERDRLTSMGAKLERRVVPTKEYPEGQEAYEIEFPNAPAPHVSDPERPPRD